MILLTNVSLLSQQKLRLLGAVSSLEIEIFKVEFIFFEEIVDDIPGE